jgi:hypothetical protein
MDRILLGRRDPPRLQARERFFDHIGSLRHTHDLAVNQEAL